MNPRKRETGQPDGRAIRDDSLATHETILKKISALLFSSLDSEMVFQTLVEELGRSLSVCRCVMSLPAAHLPDQEPSTFTFRSECCANTATDLMELWATDSAATRSSANSIVVRDVETDELISRDRSSYLVAQVHSFILSPVQVHTQSFGRLGLQKCIAHQWTDWEIRLVEAIADQAALAIRQGELFREAKEAATRANLITHIVTSMRRSLDLHEILQSAAVELGKALKADRVYFRRRIGNVVQVEAQYASHPSFAVEEQVYNPDASFAEFLANSPKTIVIDDLDAFLTNHKEAFRLPSLTTSPRAKSVILCPLMINQELWGGFLIGQMSKAKKWTPNEIAMVEAVAAQIEIAIAHSELFHSTRQAATIESLIRHISQTVNQASTMEDVYQDVARELGKYFNTDSLIISRYDPLTDLWHLECSFSRGVAFKPKVQAYKHSDFASLAATRKDGLLISNDVEKDPVVAPYLNTFFRPAGIHAFLIQNLYYEDEVRLSIGAFSKTGPRAWSPQDINILRAVGDQMLIAFKRAELFDEVLRVKFEWETTFDALADGLLIFDEHGILRRVNQAGAAMEGQEIPDMIGRICCSLLQGSNHEECKVMQVIETGEPVTFEIVPRKMARPVLITISPLGGQRAEGAADSYLDQAKGRQNQGARGAVCIVRDLSELRAAEAAARELNNYLVKLVEHAGDAICALSPSGGLIWCNEHFVTMTGCPRQDLMGTGYQRFIPDNERSAISQSFIKALSGESQATEMHTLKNTDEEMLLMVTFIPINDEGRVTGVLMISRDITEEKLASERESQAEKMRMLGQIAAGVAHNFNNILAAVLGHAQLIKRTPNEERIMKQAEIIERAALDGAEMVKRIQSFGNQQNDAGYEPVDINQLIKDSVGLTRARWEGEAQARGLAYEVRTDLNPLPIVYGSASEIREVFVNIILNSLDAMPTGGVLRITTTTGKDSVLIHFTDRGIGMSEEVRKHIFEPFFTTKGPSGTGLGLAVSYSAIERHGGLIEVISTPGRGSTFSVSLPAQEVSPFLGWQKAHPFSDPKTTLRMLIIDDDDRVREALVEMVKILGYQVDDAATGARALEKLHQERFDLVLTDLSMPGMDGWTVATEVRRIFPKIKIVMLTGYSKPIELFSSNQEIADEILSKPVRLDELSLKISQLFK